MIRLEKNTKLLFWGDSITDGGRKRSMDGNHILGHGYQSIIASKLGYENIENMPRFINKGASGETIAQLYARIKQDVIDNKPDIISILAGINDINKRQGMPYKSTTDNYIRVYQMIIDDIRENLNDPVLIICEPFFLELRKSEAPYQNTPYALCEPYFEPAHNSLNDKIFEERRREISYMQRELKLFALKNNCIYVTLQNEFFEMAKKAAPEYLIWDSVHPTITGHELIARRWLETVEGELNKG